MGADGVDRRRRGENRRAREESGELSMKASTNPPPKGKSPSQQIDAIIKEPGDWRGKKLSQLRALLKNAVRLTFPKGAQMKDPKKLFNTRLESNTVRAIDFHEGGTVDEAALKALILDAVGLNTPKE